MKVKNMFPVLTAFFLLVSCNSDDTLTPAPGAQAGDAIRFEINFADDGQPRLRASTGVDFKTSWESGDEIGVFAVKSGESLAASGNLIRNVKLTYENGSWSGEIYWPNGANKNESLDFYAYYPYDATMTDPTNYIFSVETDQRAEAGYNKSDLLLATAANQSKGEVVNLQLSHALILVQVEVKREVNMPLFEDDNFTVTLTNVLPGATLGWGSTLQGTGTATDMVMHKVEGLDYTYRALVPVQALNAESEVNFLLIFK